MGIKYEGTTIPTSFASCSVPKAVGGSLPDKLKAIRDAGFDAIELSMPDIMEYGRELRDDLLVETDYDDVADVASKIRIITQELGLDILMLQPFARFEGWSKSKHPEERKDAFNRARGWMKVMEAAGTTMLQIGSSDSEEISSDTDEMAADLGELADIFAEKGLRIAYENWCWATHAPTWKSVWEIVKKANRPNLGLCLDTFQTAGSELADPSTSSGYIEGGVSKADLETRWRNSLLKLSETVPPEKIFLLQISDAYKMKPPIDSCKDLDGQGPRARWSYECRPLPGGGGYLPVREVLEAVLRTGFKGYLSVEVFDGMEIGMSSLQEYMGRAMESLNKLVLSTEDK
ncbi:3-dehydroshikimate dehydratase [Cladobotryum mycophilum]|uniref:3-dehydroshikimate dehydratase n=1 Tax=Cladobotryum mycophilum TaxID=491253 RepID=A0ABR0SNW4_9HYPO